MSDIHAALLANRYVLHQGLDLLDRLSDEAYTSPRLNTSPVGAQYRHVLEHYHCFLEGLSSGRVDYDARRRDPALESSRARAAQATRVVLAELSGLSLDPHGAVEVQMRSAAEADRPEWRPSSLGRELQFLVSHTVHHFALIKLLLHGDHLELGWDFGVAPSTLAYERARHS